VIGTLSVVLAIQWGGASSVLPGLPLWLRGIGASPALIGVVLSAVFVGALVVQVPAARWIDGHDPRLPLLLGVTCYAAASAGFVFCDEPALAMVLRLLQGVGTGATQIAALSAVRTTQPPRKHGAAFAKIFGAAVVGAAAGPVVATLIGATRFRLLFDVAAGVALVTLIPSLVAARLLGTAARSQVPGSAERTTGSLWSLLAVRDIRGSMYAGVAYGVILGVFEACWTLRLALIGASATQISLSWTAFCLPFVAVSFFGGSFVDRLNQRRTVIVSTLLATVFTALCCVISNPTGLIVLAALEAGGEALMQPSLETVLVRAAPDGQSAQTQGLFASARTIATALAASAGGAAFGWWHPLPFVAGALIAAGCLGAAVACWSYRPVPALRAAPIPGPDAMSS
jgi:MFS family permease